MRSRGAPNLSRYDTKKGDETASLRSAEATSLTKVPEDPAPEDQAPEDQAPEDQAPEDQAPEGLSA